MNAGYEPSNGSEGVAPVKVIRWRAALVHLTLLAFAATILVRAARVQLIDGEVWTRRAAVQQFRSDTVLPPRGAILDAGNTVLAETRELIRVGITPANVLPTKKNKDAPEQLRSELKRLGVSDRTIRQVFDTSRKWVETRQLFRPSEVAPLLKMPGVRFMWEHQRQYSASAGMSRILGAVDAAGVARGGLEEELDYWLSGSAGRRALVKDPSGLPMESPQVSSVEARQGHTVVLTLNQSLQDIAERELRTTMEQTGASGGDIVIVDARDGAILAMAGARNGKPAPATTALTEAYEPGSVMKPFIVSRLLDIGRAQEQEIINTENGRWQMDGRRLPISDEHRAPTMSVRDVIRYSSNIGAVKLALRLSPAEEYEVLRDFGFGVPTGVSFTSESRGRLRPPQEWTKPTASAYAMGYELSATPLQIAMAYGAIASGGELLQSTLVREIRAADGTPVYKHERRVVRRVLSSEGASQMRDILASVVDSGTSTAARLELFDVAGKSGTARRWEGRGYVANGYNASFAGMFPAEKPQFVFVARLIDPKGVYFGGVVAAPMVRAVLREAIAARDGSLDKVALAAVARKSDAERAAGDEGADPVVYDTPMQRILSDRAGGADSVRTAEPGSEQVAAPARVVVSLKATDSSRERRTRAPASPVDLREIPRVEGLNLRDAVRALRAAGFEVRLGKGMSGKTHPAAGTKAPAGSIVTLEMAQ